MGLDGQYGRLVSPPRELRFDVFGRRMAVRDDGRGWRVYVLGTEGKRRAADVVIPPGLEADAIGTWLADVFHEAATPRHPGVRPLD